jgi:2-succinyl-5-enolpyruvyl-6-hydroxy-3-cyclohexene-1-carboxylate synthase
MHTENMNMLWAGLLIEQFDRAGVDCFCLSPGSRSTPLVAALAGRPGWKPIVHYDERGAAFYALGHARATGRPAVCVTTSGTAAANLFPAVMEAARSRIPIILLTADRPPELRDTGANQAVDQVNLFGRYARWFFDLPCPTREMDPRAVLTVAAQALHHATRRPRGPVHINCSFREPLEPRPDGRDVSDYLEPVSGWLAQSSVYGEHVAPVGTPDPDALDALAASIRSARRGLVVVGQLADETETFAVQALVRALDWPALPDITSGLRVGGGAECLIPYYDLLLASDAFRLRHAPDVILQVGGRLTSRRLLDYLASARPSPYALVSDHPDRDQPHHRATINIESDVAAFCEALLPRVEGAGNQEWLNAWRSASQAADRKIDELLAGSNALSEPAVARLVTRWAGRDDGLVLASSMPVRDANTFGDGNAPCLRLASNRGASGIDGTVATAAGFAGGLGRPTTLLIGDLALLHDLNSLALARNGAVPFVVVALNNNGSGIFHFLPVAGHADLFEKYFGAPHGLRFKEAAAMFGWKYHAPADLPSFEAAYTRARSEPGATLLEISTDRIANHALHLDWQAQVVAAVEQHV